MVKIFLGEINKNRLNKLNKEELLTTLMKLLNTIDTDDNGKSFIYHDEDTEETIEEARKLAFKE